MPRMPIACAKATQIVSNGIVNERDSKLMVPSSPAVIEKGQVLTGYYRLMNKSGGYTWLQTCATVVCSTKNADEQNIICVNYVIR